MNGLYQRWLTRVLPSFPAEHQQACLVGNFLHTHTHTHTHTKHGRLGLCRHRSPLHLHPKTPSEARRKRRRCWLCWDLEGATFFRTNHSGQHHCWALVKQQVCLAGRSAKPTESELGSDWTHANKKHSRSTPLHTGCSQHPTKTMAPYHLPLQMDRKPDEKASLMGPPVETRNMAVSHSPKRAFLFLFPVPFENPPPGCWTFPL